MALGASLFLREKQHLFDGTSPNVATRHSRRALEADGVLLHFSVNRVSQVDDEHFALEVDFRDFGPPEVLDTLADREGADAWVVDANVELRPAVILCRVRVDAVGFETAGNQNELVVHGDDILARLPLSVKLDDFLFKLEWLTEGEFQWRHVVLCMDFSIKVAKFICKKYESKINKSRIKDFLINLSGPESFP